MSLSCALSGAAGSWGRLSAKHLSGRQGRGLLACRRPAWRLRAVYDYSIRQTRLLVSQRMTNKPCSARAVLRFSCLFCSPYAPLPATFGPSPAGAVGILEADAYLSCRHFVSSSNLFRTDCVPEASMIPRCRRGAYMHQLQLLSQQADHQAPSASSTQSTAMLASLLASNPALLQAMQLPPAVVDAGVGATSSAATQKEAGSDVKHSVGGDAADANTAVGAASTLQLGTAGSLQTSMLVTKPKAAVAAQQPAFAPAPAAGPAPITSGGPTLTSSALRSNSASAFVAAGSVRSIELGLHSSSMNGVAHAAAAVGKRSATGDMKPVVGRRDSAALPPKKRLDAAGDSTGDAERDAYSSLARMRCVSASKLAVQWRFLPSLRACQSAHIAVLTAFPSTTARLLRRKHICLHRAPSQHRGLTCFVNGP